MMKNSKKIKVISLILLVTLILTAFAGCQTEKDLNAKVDVQALLDAAVLQYPATNGEFRYNVYENFVRITEYLGEDTKINIPGTIDGLPVYSIAGTTFSYENFKTEKGEYLEPEDTPLYYIEEINIGENVYEIQAYTFADLPSLKKVTIPETVTVIGENAFSNCLSLNEITIPSAVQVIPDNLCYNCEVLTSVTINEVEESAEEAEKGKQPDVSVASRTIGMSAFANCYNLRYVWMPKDIATIDDTAFSNSTKYLVMSGYSKGAGAQHAAAFLIDFIVLDKDEYTNIIEDVQPAVTTTDIVNLLKQVDITPIYKNFDNVEKNINYSASDKTLRIKVTGENDMATNTVFVYKEGSMVFTRDKADVTKVNVKADKFWIESMIKVVATLYGYDADKAVNWFNSSNTNFENYTIDKHGIEITKSSIVIDETTYDYYSSVKISLINGIKIFDTKK
jgi:hypothetical protein